MGCLASAQTTRESIAETTGGRWRGRVDGGTHIFKGIRYGADTRPRRFLPPVPPPPWTGVRDALEFGPIAPQPSSGGRADQRGLPAPERVDAGTSRRGKRPVMVWFHGGAYSSGTSNEIETDGARLSRRGDVVVVTVNHRLNAFGYLYLAEFGGAESADSGNVGQLDLILALEWVRDNIAEFGGDPGNVTIFGHSGGGAKSATLMAMPKARGLFHRVITQSGQQVTASRVTTAARNAATLVDALALPGAGTIDRLRTLPMEQIVKVSRAPAYLGPVKDGRSLPRDPFDPDAPPLSADIPMILGNTKGETRTLIGRGDPSLFSLTWETLQAKLEANSPFMGQLESRRGHCEVPRVASGRIRRPTCSLPPPPIRDRGADRSSKPIAVPRSHPDRRRRMCFSSTGPRRSTAASGARITASMCRSCSTTRRSRRIWSAPATSSCNWRRG